MKSETSVRTGRRRLLSLMALGICPPLPGHAQDRYPSRPVRMIVPFTPAGATDILARMTAEELSRRLGKNVVVENRPGAGGNLGGELAARAPADGYTILMAPSTVYAAGTALYPRRSFSLERDFVPVSTVAYVPHVLVVSAQTPANSVRELVGLAKAKPGGLNIASQGVGTISHLEAELFQTMTGTRMVHVPYKGSAPAHVDLLGGRVQVMFDSVAATLPHIRSGRLKALGVTTPKRAVVLPDVPTITEAGVVGYVSESWLGILVPAKVPGEIVDRLSREVRFVVDLAAFARRLADHGFEAHASVGREYGALMKRETAYWGSVVRKAGIRLD